MENGLVLNFVGIILMVWNQEICVEKVGVMCNIALTAWYCISGIAGAQVAVLSPPKALFLWKGQVYKVFIACGLVDDCGHGNSLYGR